MTELQAQNFFAQQVSFLQQALESTSLNKKDRPLLLGMEVLREAPKSSSFVSLSDHQSATPASFYSGPPVLHYHSDRCKVVILERDLSISPALTILTREAPTVSAFNGPDTNGGVEHTNGDIETESQKVLENVDVWVTSEKLLLFCSPSSTGLSIPYPSISLHAIQSLPVPTAGEQQGLYMQLISAPSDDSEEDEEPDSISLILIPSSAGSAQTTSSDTETSTGNVETPAAALFTALSNCSNLHPDPVDPNEPDEADLQDSALFQAGMLASGSQSGGLPPPMPGSGGWITAENMGEYIDEDGNWIGGEEDQAEEVLGPGAGTVRSRDGDEDLGEENGDGDDAKWRRTS